MRLLVTGGGTGGHVYPALAVADRFRAEEILYVGSTSGVERRIASEAGLPFSAIASGAILGQWPPTALWNLGQLLVGMAQSLAILGRFRPQVVLATGGYVCVPVVTAAWLWRVPRLLYQPDILPGLAVRFLSRFATRIAVSFEESRSFLPRDKVVATGYPVRPELKPMERRVARQQLGLPREDKMVLVLGGSRGARRINRAIVGALAELLPQCVVVHSCGPSHYEALERERRTLLEPLRQRYRLYPYLGGEMAAALAAADLVVSRAGASTLGEFPAFGVPSVLVPYPYAGAHQEANADFMVRSGAAVKVADAEVEGKLAATVGRLLADANERARLATGARRLARPQAAQALAAEVSRIAKKGAA